MRTVKAALGVAVLVGVFAAGSSPAYAWDCNATAYTPSRVAPTTLEHRGRAVCNVLMDSLTVTVCEQRHRKDGSGIWDNTECHSRGNSGRSSVMLAFNSGCADGWYYRTAARWSGVKCDAVGCWGGGDLNYAVSGYVRC
jgi:hypothetical protein